MSIRTKVTGCLILVLALCAGASFYGLSRSRTANARLALIHELYLPLSRQIAQIQSSTHGLAEDLRRFYFKPISSPDTSTFARLVRDLYPYRIGRKFADAEEKLARQQELGNLQTDTSEITKSLAAARALFESLTATPDRERFERTYAELRLRLDNLSRAVEEECQSITSAAHRESQESLWTGLGLCVFVLISGTMTLWLSHRALRPLPVLIGSLKKIADGDFDQSLKVSTADQDEISLLAREYNRMLAALGERDREIKRQQVELLQSERLAAVGQLSAEIVHEIRNPLNSISLNIDWLDIALQGRDPEVSRTLSSISKEIGRLHQITESYLVRARVPAQDAQKTELNDLVREILDFSREEDRSKRIEVALSLWPEDLFVRSDRSRLKQAFLNVLKNAKEAMPNGGQLSVRTEAHENVCRVVVSDTGYGMNETTLTRTFQPFFTTKQNGTGLGLTLTKSIVEEAQGAVQCESHVGRGTTFTIQFPA